MPCAPAPLLPCAPAQLLPCPLPHRCFLSMPVFFPCFCPTAAPCSSCCPAPPLSLFCCSDVETVINLGVDGILTNRAPDVMAAVNARLAEALDYSGSGNTYGPGQMAGAIVGSLLVGGIAVLAINFGVHRCRQRRAGGAGAGGAGASVNTASSAGFYTPYSHVAGDAGN